MVTNRNNPTHNKMVIHILGKKGGKIKEEVGIYDVFVKIG